MYYAACRLEERAAVAVASRVRAVEDGERADGDHEREDEQNSEHSDCLLPTGNARDWLLFQAQPGD